MCRAIPTDADTALCAAVLARRWRDLTERLVALEQTIERLQLLEVVPAQGTRPMFLHEAAEPLAQIPRLVGHHVELARQRLRSHALEHRRGYQLRLL
jgi:hypothetical protein